MIENLLDSRTTLGGEILERVWEREDKGFVGKRRSLLPRGRGSCTDLKT